MVFAAEFRRRGPVAALALLLLPAAGCPAGGLFGDAVDPAARCRAAVDKLRLCCADYPDRGVCINFAAARDADAARYYAFAADACRSGGFTSALAGRDTYGAADVLPMSCQQLVQSIDLPPGVLEEYELERPEIVEPEPEPTECEGDDCDAVEAEDEAEADDDGEIDDTPDADDTDDAEPDDAAEEEADETLDPEPDDASDDTEPENPCEQPGVECCTPNARVCNGLVLRTCRADGLGFAETRCDDGIACTVETCDPGAGCRSAPDNGLCNDNVGCTVDVCNPARGCENTPDDARCNDNGECTVDRCDRTAGCSNLIALGSPCTDDGNLCTVGEACAADTQGLPICAGTVVDCSNLTGSRGTCSRGRCAPATGLCEVVFDDLGAPCDDGNPNTLNDRCQDVQDRRDCRGDPRSCTPSDPSNPCIAAQFDPVRGCIDVPVREGEACNDNNPCTRNTICALGRCVARPDGIVPCTADGNPCTKDTCDPATGLCNVPDVGAACDDGDPCTVNDTCASAPAQGGGTTGVCRGSPRDCSSLDGACVRGVCVRELEGRCTSEPRPPGTACAVAGSLCYGGAGDGVCQGTACVPGAVSTRCNDNNACTAECCIDNLPNPLTAANCRDAAACAGVDLCDLTTLTIDRARGCVTQNIASRCDDQNPCTVDRCDPATGCANDAAAADGRACSPGGVCGGAGTCRAGVCSAVPVSCTQLDGECLAGTCVDDGGRAVCEARTRADGTLCRDAAGQTTVDDVCAAGACRGTALPAPFAAGTETRRRHRISCPAPDSTIIGPVTVRVGLDHPTPAALDVRIVTPSGLARAIPMGAGAGTTRDVTLVLNDLVPGTADGDWVLALGAFGSGAGSLTRFELDVPCAPCARPRTCSGTPCASGVCARRTSDGADTCYTLERASGAACADAVGPSTVNDRCLAGTCSGTPLPITLSGQQTTTITQFSECTTAGAVTAYARLTFQGRVTTRLVVTAPDAAVSDAAVTTNDGATICRRISRTGPAVGAWRFGFSFSLPAGGNPPDAQLSELVLFDACTPVPAGHPCAPQ